MQNYEKNITNFVGNLNKIMGRKKLEICIDSIGSAVIAQDAGADSIELCDNLFEGGTTPSIGMIKRARKSLSIDINVMVRPRGGDFLYSPLEFEIMKEDIRQIKDEGADGIVTGILLEDGNIDIIRTAELIKIAGPMQVTFHRAFDMSPDPIKSIEDIIKSGARRILSSGHQNSVMDGLVLMKSLIENSGHLINIVPGGGINVKNIKEVIGGCGALEYHLTARSISSSFMKYRKDGIYMGGLREIPEFDRKIADRSKILAVRKILDSYT